MTKRSHRYNGLAITWDHNGEEMKMQVTGRITIDTDSFNRYSTYRIRHIKKWKPKDVENLKGYQSLNDDEAGYHQSTDRQVELTPHYQMLCRNRVRGYSLKCKAWLDFFVDLVTEIEWNNNALENLVMPPDQKELILSLSKSQLTNRQRFDDIIQGKGKGFIILLAGPPGTGKTLTAEAVAEELHVPLYSLTFADLGPRFGYTRAESRLEKVLELVARWRAILLLDECDIFLERRSADDLDRNTIVSAFLRTIEYYSGIMFMTTNRVTNIDDAFKSRIHLSLEYPELDERSRRQIWSNLLISSNLQHELSELDLDEFAKEELNGRQIKNVMKMAELLAAEKKEPLKRGFIDTIIGLEARRSNSANVTDEAAVSSGVQGQTAPSGKFESGSINPTRLDPKLGSEKCKENSSQALARKKRRRHN